MVNADGGGTSSAFGPLEEEGIATLWHIDQWSQKSLFETLDLATKGWWPADVGVPDSSLLEPTKKWRECPFCHEVSGATMLVGTKACVTCKKEFPPGIQLPLRVDPINGLEEVGLLVFEGLTAFGELMLQALRVANPDGGNTIRDKDFTVANVGQQHYLIAQKQLGQFVANVRTIPVDVIIWTALEIKSTDDGKPLYGPQGPGKALTSACIPWFTSVLHLDAVAKRDAKGLVMKDANGVEVLERKLYLAPHFPSDNPAQRFAAKTSAPLGGGMPSVIEPSMTRFFAELEAAKARVREKISKGSQPLS